MRVVPAWLAWPVKSNRQRPCGQISLASPTATSRSTRSRPCSTCSSTKVPTRSGQPTTAEAPRREAGAAGRLDRVGRKTPSRSRSSRAFSQVIAPVTSREPRHARPKREPSSSTKAETPIGRSGSKPRSRSRSMAARRRDHAQRAVVRTPVEHRVEVRPGEHRGRAVVRALTRRRLSPPRDHVADEVGLHRQAARARLLEEPGAQLGLGRGPGLAEVATRRGRAPHRRQVPPHLLEPHACSPSATRGRVNAAPRQVVSDPRPPAVARARCNAVLVAVPTPMHGGG